MHFVCSFCTYDNYSVFLSTSQAQSYCFYFKVEQDCPFGAAQGLKGLCLITVITNRLVSFTVRPLFYLVTQLLNCAGYTKIHFLSCKILHNKLIIRHIL